jgi:hypothetical protein
MAGRTGDAKGKESMPQKTGNFVTGWVIISISDTRILRLLPATAESWR